MRTKYHIYLNYEERRLLINSLNDLRNELIAEGRYTDLVDEVLIKVANAKNQENQGVQQMPVNGIFAVFGVWNDITLPHPKQYLKSRINTDVFTPNFAHNFDY